MQFGVQIKHVFILQLPRELRIVGLFSKPCPSPTSQTWSKEPCESDTSCIFILTHLNIFLIIHAIISAGYFRFWTYASFLSTVIPLFPLASLYEGWWHVESDVSRPHYTVIFSLFIFMGLAYTIGSYFFHRAVRHPHVPPLLTWYHMSTDELASMWWFMLGTVPSIPVCAIYCYYYGSLGQYGLALAISIVCSIVMVVAVLATYPTDGEHVSHLLLFLGDNLVRVWLIL